VPVPVVIDRPPCVSRPPPVPGDDVTPGSSAETRWIRALARWSAVTWALCRPVGALP
jgi:hypothetical protein